MKQLLSIGYSPCPNDTFIFHGVSHGLISVPDIDFAPATLADVETLNNWALAAKLDITKLSFHALGHVVDQYVLLDSGSALGRGCGPLLVAGRPFSVKDLVGAKIAIPGHLTTAAMLTRLFAPDCTNLVPMRFDRIMAAILAGEVAAGVIIHESRFTYAGEGLVLIKDLGEWWENQTGHPIPLGGIAARRSLGDEKIRQIELAIRQSIEHAFADPSRAMPYIRKHAQEMDEKVVNAHINLYVNDFSLSLGRTGHAAIAEFMCRGREVGVIPDFGPFNI